MPISDAQRKQDAETVTISEARDGFAELVDAVRFTRQSKIITRHGRPVAVLAPVEEAA